MLDYRPVAEQDVLRVWEDSVLAIDKLATTETGADKVTDTQLDLRGGRMFFSVKKLSAASRFEIKIPNGVAGIRGTIGMVSAEGILAILSGSGVLAYLKGDGTPVTQVVPAGYEYDARTGELTPLPPHREAELDRTAQECHFNDQQPPPGPPGPIQHYSDQEDNNSQGLNQNGQGPL